MDLSLSVTDTDDFFDVYQESKAVAANWEGLWIALRLPVSDRHIMIKNDHNHGDCEKCLMATIERWLNKNYNTVQHGEPSWKMLARAVANDCGGKNYALAQKIARNHGGIILYNQHSTINITTDYVPHMQFL